VRVKIVARLEHDQLTPYGLVVHHHHPPTRIGKTTVAASVGSIFAQLRQDGRVVAIDADTAFGKLTARVDLHATGSYWDLAGPPTSTSTPSPTCAKGSDALPQSWHRLGHRHVPLEAKLCGYGAVAVPIVALGFAALLTATAAIVAAPSRQPQHPTGGGSGV
jgi:hypothetical protein